MIRLLMTSFILALIVNAIHIITSEGMVFGFVQDYIYKKARMIKLSDGIGAESKYLFYWKPLFLCPPCMCSIWGTTFYLLIIDKFEPVNYITTILCACYMALILNKYANN